MAKEHIRGFAKFFTHLTPGQQREMERALAELDNQQEVTNLNSTLLFLRRKPNQNIPVPNVVASPLVRGVSLEWQPLTDQRIGLYEIQVSKDPNFADFITSSTFGNSAVIEGLLSTTFIRIRGIRSNGTQGPFSDTIVVNPLVFAIKARIQETFYFRISSVGEVQVLGGPGSIFEYRPINDTGFTMVWGNLVVYGNPALEVTGKSDFEIKFLSRDFSKGILTEEWKITPTGYWGSYQIGPFAVPHPEEQGTLELGVVAKDISNGVFSPSFYPSVILYGHLSAFELGINLDESGMITEEEVLSGN